LWQGLTAKLNDAKAKIEQALQEQIRSGYALMLVDNQKLLENALVEFFPNLINTKAKSIQIKNSHALNDGIAQGKEINIHAGLNGGTSPLQIA